MSAKRLLWRLLCVALCLPGLSRAEPELVLSVQLEPAQRRLEAVAQFVPTAGRLRFPLHQGLQLQAAWYGEEPLQLRVVGAREDWQLWEVMLPGERDGRSVKLQYQGRLPVLDASLDHRAVLGDLPPMMSSQGSWLPAGSHWHPLPAASFSYRLQLSVPAGQRALVPGRLLSEQLPAGEDGSYQAEFAAELPVGGITLMAGPWQVSEDFMTAADGRRLRLRTYFTPALQARAGLAQGYLEDSSAWISHYERLIGAYPFDGFAVVAAPLPTGFGMAGLTYLGEQVLALPFIRQTSLRHEVLHNWWGSGVRVDYASGNWAEGLTTFMADYAYAEERGEAAASAMRLGWLRDLAALPAGEEASLRQFRARTHGAAAALGYGKGTMLFVMLRDLIGEAAFADGVRQLWAQQRFHTAGWAALEDAFSSASGRDLSGFFRQWLEQAGSAGLVLEDAVFQPAATGVGGRLRLQLSQQGEAHDFHLPVTLEDGTGRREQHWVALAREQTMVELEVAARPHAVGLDTDFRLWRKLPPAQLPPILRQWMLSAAPALVLADAQAGVWSEAAEEVAGRLFERRPRRLSVAELGAHRGELMLVGSPAALDALYARLQLPPPPAALPAMAAGVSAQLWTQVLDNGPRLLVVAVRDVAALRALARPLPHYGGQSWLQFAGSRLQQRGVWASAGQMLAVRDEP